MYVKIVAALTGVYFLSACSNTVEITQEPVLYTKTVELNEKGTTSFVVRAYLKEGSSRNELSGVPCVFKGVGFGSEFVTPATVIAPDMGARTPVASVTCVYSDMEEVRVMPPFNRTLAEINETTSNAAANHGLIGAVVGSIAAGVQKSRRDPTLDVYAYRSSRIEFEIE